MQHVNSKAALKRLPIGTRLRLVHSLIGPCNQGKEVFEVKSNCVIMRNTDGPKAGNLSHLYLDGVSVVRATTKGFALWDIDGDREILAAEYEFEA